MPRPVRPGPAPIKAPPPQRRPPGSCSVVGARGWERSLSFGVPELGPERGAPGAPLPAPAHGECRGLQPVLLGRRRGSAPRPHPDGPTAAAPLARVPQESRGWPPRRGAVGKSRRPLGPGETEAAHARKGGVSGAFLLRARRSRCGGGVRTAERTGMVSRRWRRPPPHLGRQARLRPPLPPPQGSRWARGLPGPLPGGLRPPSALVSSVLPQVLVGPFRPPEIPASAKSPLL